MIKATGAFIQSTYGIACEPLHTPHSQAWFVASIAEILTVCRLLCLSRTDLESPFHFHPIYSSRTKQHPHWKHPEQSSPSMVLNVLTLAAIPRNCPTPLD